MKRYNEFINEKKHNTISLFDIEQTVEDIFNDTVVSSVSTIYEKDKKTNQLKLIMTINNLFYNETDIIHTKFIFYVDDKKQKLISNKFSYLYDINCNFKTVDFTTVVELKNKLDDIIANREFGADIKNLSDINVTISTDVNKWFHDNNVNNISIYNISYKPIVDNIPCESLSFKFIINVDDSRSIDMILKKVSNSEYRFTFKENEWFYDVTVSDIKGMVQTIGETIKKYIK